MVGWQDLGSSIPLLQLSSGPGPRPRPCPHQSVPLSQTRPETTHPPSASIRYHPPHQRPHSSSLSQLACLHITIDRSAGLEWRSAETRQLVSGARGRGGRGPALPILLAQRHVLCPSTYVSTYVSIVIACQLFILWSHGTARLFNRYSAVPYSMQCAHTHSLSTNKHRDQRQEPGNDGILLSRLLAGTSLSKKLHI